MTGYNGWANYETWCVNLWLGNDESLYCDMIELAREYRSHDDDGTGDHGDTYALGNAIRAYVDDLPEVSEVMSSASFVSDLLGAALSEVRWSDIAESWLEDMADDETETVDTEPCVTTRMGPGPDTRV